MAATVAHSHFFIGTAKACVSASDYASDTWTEVLGVTDLGEVGDTADEIKYSVIGEARVRKLAGTRDAGDFTITAARNNADPGQIAMNVAAQGTPAPNGLTILSPFNFKVTLDDGSVIYFTGPVLQASTKFGQANSVVERMWKVAVSSQPIEA